MVEMDTNLVPIVIEQTGRGERSYDIYSRLLKDRIVFVDGEYGGAPFQRLLVAQDTGGAIRRGPNRGDVFAGIGAEAGAYAERMNSAGPRWYTLLPKSFSAPLAANPHPSPG